MAEPARTIGGAAEPPSTIPAALRATAARHPDRDALVDGPTRLSYRELDAAVLDVVRGLLALGVRPGDRVAIWAQNCWQWCVACLGVAAAGAVLVPVNTRFRGREAAYLLTDSAAVALFTTTGFLGTDYPAVLRAAAPQFRALPVVVMDGPVPGDLTDDLTANDPAADDSADDRARASDLSWRDFLARGAGVPLDTALARLDGIRPDDVSDIMYTSGTTGFPKGVVQTHGKNLLAMRSLAAALDLRAGDRNLVLAPLFAQFGLRCGLFIDLIAGAASVLDSVFDPARIVGLIERERITTLPGPPTILAALLSPLADGHDLSSLRVAITGSTVIPEDLVISLLERRVFEHVLTAYGLTEACGPVSVSALTDTPAQVSTYAGRVLDHLELRVVGPDGTVLGPHQRGELLVRAPTVMNGYLNDPEQTRAAIDADGWLRTGDIGLVDEHGYVQITGRVKDMVIVGGLNVYPAEVEAVLREHPAIRDVALVGIPDERLGEVGLAFVVPEPGHPFDAGALYTWSRAELANYKVPRVFVELDELPLNSSLKVDKPVLRDRAAAHITSF